MSLTPADIVAIRSSWAIAASVKAEAGRMFYATLFEMAPEARPLFPEDMRGQEIKLMRTLGTVVDSLDDLEDILPTLDRLGQTHIGYGAEPAHYEIVGAALIATFETLLGPDFTEKRREAWIKAYALVSDRMISAAA